jgi:outer membrane protein OmpA-like peptidoglycan-associated protein
MKITTLCLFLVTFSSFSQNWQYTKSVGINAGVYKFLGDRVDLAAMGDWNGLSLGYGISPFISFTLDADYGSFKPKKQGSFYQKDNQAPFRTFVIPVVGSMRLTCIPEGRIKPYLTVGSGILFWDLRDITITNQTFWDFQSWRWGRRVSGFRKNILITEGIGLELYIDRNVILDWKTRFSSLLEQKSDNVGYGDVNNQILESTVTLSFSFGGIQDSDDDGIDDKHDQAPFDPEDIDQFQDEDGIPDPDNDNDGIPDLVDKCPMDPEDHDGWQDQDGCPDPDNDNDGILDINDKCPNVAEDFDGFQDQDGCPDPDNDNDGIPDVCDRCPNEAETVNGFEDTDGCPDEVPKQSTEIGTIAPVQQDTFVLKGINFKSGSADLMQESYPLLQQVVDELNAHPELRLEIRGHTDNQGNADSNQQLSQRRANTVMDYLVAQGINAERLTAIGKGDQDPVASNLLPEGRAQNRRIEFVRLK